MSAAAELSRRALCQDCLRAHDVAALKCDAGDPPGRCPACGGQACDCNFCLVGIAALEAGQFDLPMFTGTPIASWSAAGGAVKAAANV